MVDKIERISEPELLDKLKSLPLEEVPPDLTTQVMSRISSSRTSLLRSVWNFVSRPQTISFRPVYAFSVLLLICTTFFAGRFSQPVSEPGATMAPIPNELRPAMIEAPRSAYLVGRGLLQADGGQEQALAFLQRASMLEPDNPEFAYWEGIGHWANGNQERERKSYLRGLGSDPENIALLINLGHSYLGGRNYHEALNTYQAVLARLPAEPAALYNSGLIYRALGMQSEEISSWQSYLQYHRQGTKSFRALKRLHAYGDYTYRSYQIGGQNVIVNQRLLLEEAERIEVQRAELVDIGEALERDGSLKLEIIVFIENDREAARELAVRMRKMVSRVSLADVAGRVGLSWFDEPETIRATDGSHPVMLPEGLLLFTHPIEKNELEVSI